MARAQVEALEATFDDRAVDALVEALDRLPLAIELAAARAAVLGPAELMERLGGTSLHSTGREDRQASLRKVFGWATQRLDGPQRLALRQCAVFSGPFTLEAAEAVIELPASAPPVHQVVHALVRHSLLAILPGAGPRRFAMLRTIAAFTGPVDARAAQRRAAFEACATSR